MDDVGGAERGQGVGKRRQAWEKVCGRCMRGAYLRGCEVWRERKVLREKVEGLTRERRVRDVRE